MELDPKKEIDQKPRMTRTEYEENKQKKLSKKFGAVMDEVISEEMEIFKEWGDDLSLKDDFSKIIECQIEGYDVQLCLKVCFNDASMTDLFLYFQENSKDHAKYVEARMFSINKVVAKLHNNLKMYRNEPVLYNKDAMALIRTVKEVGKADISIRSKIKKDAAGEEGDGLEDVVF